MKKINLLPTFLACLVLFSCKKGGGNNPISNSVEMVYDSSNQNPAIMGVDVSANYRMVDLYVQLNPDN
ncbi:hypothetical protein ABTN40_19955, partial [Acinetobacter baumannii]